ncbi:MAG: hypothetical protein QOF60_3157 [Actinomycetota bacterium]|nr:hypothetical protein [Actinomycetota bacterium]MEA3078249.1 hypothetical protein [Actinomycetota bacterium]
MNDEELGPDDVLLAACSERAVGLVLADAISDRVDQLVDCVEATGERTSRKELIASLILDAALDGPGLATRIRRLRLATVGDVVAQVSRHQGVASNAARRPGPRARLERGAKRDVLQRTASTTQSDPPDGQRR